MSHIMPKRAKTGMAKADALVTATVSDCRTSTAAVITKLKAAATSRKISLTAVIAKP